MRLKPHRHRDSLLALGTGIFLAAGALVWGTSLLLAQTGGDEGEVYPEAKEDVRPPWERPPPPTVPRPEEEGAVDLAEGKEELSRNSDLAAIITAAESGDVDSLIAMAQFGNVCEYVLHGEVHPDCEDEGDNVAGVYGGGGLTPPLVPVDRIEGWIASVLSEQPVELEFASRDSRRAEGNGGEYYLVFRAARSAVVMDEDLDGLGIVVRPGEPQPIEWFRLVMPQHSALVWVQQLESAPYQVLIAPESVKGVPGMWDETGE